ncbi:hypothetical protein V2J09_010754 [Rumex salicifolius]
MVPSRGHPNKTSFGEANKHQAWRTVLNEEFQALLSTNTCDLVPPDPTLNVLGVYQTKRLANGDIERRKAMLVANKYHQMEGLDFNKTFSPVVKPATVRVLLSLAAISNWSMWKLGIQNAFLHGDLDETVYIRQPPDFHHPQFPNHLCRLLNHSMAWFFKLSTALIDHGFHSSCADSSLFLFCSGSDLGYILVYVDDIIVITSNPTLSSKFISTLSSLFPVKDLGRLQFFLGVQVHCTSVGFYLYQSKYILDLLKKVNISKSKPVSTPLPLHTDLYSPSPAFEDQSLYHSVIGSLQYVAFTRPDIAFGVNKLC